MVFPLFRTLRGGPACRALRTAGARCRPYNAQGSGRVPRRKRPPGFPAGRFNFLLKSEIEAALIPSGWRWRGRSGAGGCAERTRHRQAGACD